MVVVVVVVEKMSKRDTCVGCYFLLFGLFAGALFTAGVMKAARVDTTDDSISGTTLILISIQVLLFAIIGFHPANRKFFKTCTEDDNKF